MIKKAASYLKAVCLGFAVAILLCLSIVPNVYACATVERVEANVVTDDQTQLAEPVVHRMEASVATIGDSLLLGKEITDLATQKTAYEDIIRDVFDRILVGYSVEAVTLRPQTSAAVTVRVKPWGDTIRSVKVETSFAGISPPVSEFLKEHASDYEDIIENILLGLSVDSLDWASSVAKRVVNERLAEELPEFKAGFEVVGGQDVTVRLTFAPQGEIVKTVAVDLRSETIPHLVLWELRPKLETVASDLVGLPVEYVLRHQRFLCDEAVKEAEHKYSFIKKHGITIVPTMTVGADTKIDLAVETNKYRFALESYLEMGKKENSSQFKFHAGKFITPRQETFFDVQFSPGDIKWEFLPGWSYHANEKTWIGIKYNLSESDEWLFLEEALNKRWKLRAELCPRNGETEVGIRYRLYDFFSLEYVIREDDKWLRLIGNL